MKSNHPSLLNAFILFLPLIIVGGCVQCTDEEPYYPNWGDQRYRVAEYVIDLSVDSNDWSIHGVTVLRAKANVPMNELKLDLRGLDVSSVSINAQPAHFQVDMDNGKLYIDMPHTLSANQVFTAQVVYAGLPAPFASASDPTTLIGWIGYRGGVIVLGEPDGASSWYPVNNRPADKARYTLNVEVPTGFTVFANGNLTSIMPRGATTTYHWDVPWPTASYLVGLHISRLTTFTETTPTGIVLKYQYPPSLADVVTERLQQTATYLAFLEDTFGLYPFDSYGTIVIDVNTAPTPQIREDWVTVKGLETQTYSLLFFENDIDEHLATHELAHQWFGNSVGITDWRHLWIKEGLATYSEWLWDEHIAGIGSITEKVTDPDYYENFVAQYEAIPPGAPPKDNLYHPSVYIRGAMTYHALRMRLGDSLFFNLIRRFAEHYRYSTVSTNDFIQLAEEVSNDELDQFFGIWLYGDELPDVGNIAWPERG